MTSIGELRLQGRRRQVMRLTRQELTNLPLDQRVARISALSATGAIVVADLDVDMLLTEEVTDERARVRQLLVTTAREAEKSMVYRCLADSVEGVHIAALRDQPDGPFAMLGCSTPATVFIPAKFGDDVDAIDLDAEILIKGRNWKANTVDVSELPNRFEAELANWRAQDYSRYAAPLDEARADLAAALGMAEELQELRKWRLYGHSIGEAVGKEHKAQWLAMDLKLEHFILLHGRIAHVDHADDVMLLREPSAEECAKSIAPLYQQMEYFLWQAFREGYWDVRRRDALDALLLFDGSPVCEVLAAHGIAKAGESRRAEDYDAALAWCEDAEAACRVLGGWDQVASGVLAGHARLVRGDIYLAAGDAERALTSYDEARFELEHLRDEHHSPVGYQITSALWNSAVALTDLGRSPEARERTRRAKEEAERIVDTDSRAQAIIDAAQQMEL